MIPTVVIVNDDNSQLNKLADQLKTKLRVIKRSSVDGERLYGTTFFEGVIYFDEFGAKQLTRQDIYDDVSKTIDDKLKLVTPTTRALLQKYLNQVDPERKVLNEPTLK